MSSIQITSAIALMPGQYAVGTADSRIHTLLGSCVSITLWDSVRRIGAMSHFLLSRSGATKPGAQLDSRYGEDALTLMLLDLAALGVAPADCEAKIFGGATMFPALEARRGDGVGRQNGAIAQQQLREHGIRIASESLYGLGHRRIVFNVGSGAVWARQDAPDEARPDAAGAHGGGLIALPRARALPALQTRMA